MTPQQKYGLLSRMGYTGPLDDTQMENFLAANPGAAAKMGKFSRAMKKKIGMQAGGLVNPYDLFSKEYAQWEQENRARLKTAARSTPQPTPQPTSEPTSPVVNPYIQEGQYRNLDQAQQDAARAIDRLAETTRKYNENPDDPQVKAAYEEAQKNLETSQERLGVAQQQYSLVEVPSAAEATAKAVLTPEELIRQAQVAQIPLKPEQLVPMGTGQVTSPSPTPTVARAAVTRAQAPTRFAPEKMQAQRVAQQIRGETATAVQGEVSPEAQVDAVTMSPAELGQLDLQAPQIDEAVRVVPPEPRKIEEGELISGSAVDMAEVNKALDIQAAQAQPSKAATVQGQLESLMAQFEGSEPPAWAAGAMRQATAVMAQRGLAASSIAGQAVVQAAMESALPIAMADAETRAQFELQNLSNRQQTALFAAQQRAQFLGQKFDQEFQTRVANAARIADIANINFTAEQQIVLENARLAQSVDLANLDSRKAKLLSDAAAMTNVELANLNNRQQAAVANAQAFLQMDMANLSNAQQTEIFNSQAVINGLLSDQAAENAARQFNAASENQVNQFFADLESTVSRFNADQSNAIAQFNANQANAAKKFYDQLEENRAQFNAANSLVVAQANAQWRQQISTTDTAEQNESNRVFAQQTNALTSAAVDQIWQRERDIMSMAWQSAESQSDRDLRVLLADKELDAADQAGKGQIFGSIAGAVLGGIFG